ALGRVARLPAVEVGRDVAGAEPVGSVVHLAANSWHGDRVISAVRALWSMTVVARACRTCRNFGSEPTAAHGGDDSGTSQPDAAEPQTQDVTARWAGAPLLVRAVTARSG